MENDLAKDIKNIRTISRLAQIDEAYQDVYCQEGLSFLQMLLFCQMAIYGISSETVQKLVDRSASAEEIKAAFREQIMSEAFAQLRTELNADLESYSEDNRKIIVLLDGLFEKTECLTRDIVLLREETQQQGMELLEKQKEVMDRQKIAQEAQKNEVMAVMDGKFEERKYPLPERTAWKKIKGSLGDLDVKKLSCLNRALDAGIRPSKLAPYLAECSSEQFALIVCILTKEQEQGMGEGGSIYGK